MGIEAEVDEMQQRVGKVLRSCQNGLDENTLQAACLLDSEIEGLQAETKILQAVLAKVQRGELVGVVNSAGEWVLHNAGQRQ
jgi:hypothetical protein